MMTPDIHRLHLTPIKSNKYIAVCSGPDYCGTFGIIWDYNKPKGHHFGNGSGPLLHSEAENVKYPGIQTESYTFHE